ncbi:MAG: ASKHA domain-containing protein [Candidatus Thorarchaeota archaeon]
MKKHEIVFEPSGLRVLLDEQTTFLDAIRKTGLHVSSNCGGKGTCGKCIVILNPAPSPSTQDIEHISSTDIQRGSHLACQHFASTNTRVVLPDYQREVKILSEGQSVEYQWKLDPGLDDQVGIAIDLGTTTIVAYLMSLKTGYQMGQLASLNPQVAYGEDVISRITHAVREEDGSDVLSEIVVRKISELISQLMSSETNNLTRVSIVGNTAMHHLLVKADVKPLGVSPYEPTIRDAISIKGEEIGFSSIPQADVYLPPNIAGFVGGDTVGFILSQRLDLSEKVILGIDVGTNGEIILSNQGGLSCCSTAAGSAFEGATIRNGMRGKHGAIEYISIGSIEDPPEISVIGNDVPQGLCGSAIVDVTAEMFRTGILDSSGRILSVSSRIVEIDEFGTSYLITSTEESSALRSISFTQKDVRQVQLAKGAIHAGTTILLHEAELDVQDIDVVMLAGAFGSYIRPVSALGIGLFPRVDVDKVVQVGNAAGEGAKALLFSSESRRLVEKLVNKIHYVELANHDDFQSIFINSLKFPE